MIEMLVINKSRCSVVVNYVVVEVLNLWRSIFTNS